MSGIHIPAARTIAPGAPFSWLVRGWRDLLASPLASLAHGVLVALGGWGAVWLGQQAWLLLPGAFSGFLLIGPILATGLYELSRRRTTGDAVGLGTVFAAWQRGTRPLVGLGLLLFGAASAWVAVSAVMFRLYVVQPIVTLEGFLRYALAEQGATLFWLWLLAGALGSALVFAVTAVSAPLLLDKRIGLTAAVLASVRAVGDNPLPMALWAAIIMLATGFSMVTWMAGFLVTVPLLGHATWHAYRDLVDADAWPARD